MHQNYDNSSQTKKMLSEYNQYRSPHTWQANSTAKILSEEGTEDIQRHQEKPALGS